MTKTYTKEEVARTVDEVMEILDTAEIEKWFDMSDSTHNWKVWKRIKNTIGDRAKENNY